MKWRYCYAESPKPCQCVIVCAPGWATSIPVWIDGVGHAIDGETFIEGWTHWMPLPDPPKEGE